MGTRFLATEEANVPDAYKDMIVGHTAADIVYTPAFSGVPGNYLRPSVVASGIDPESLVEAGGKPALNMFQEGVERPKAWKDVWSAGHGIGTIHEITAVAEVVTALRREYEAACHVASPWSL